MTTAIEYALMAGASYRDTRPDINKFPIPAGWSLVSRNPQDNATGFEAATFGKTNQRGQLRKSKGSASHLISQNHATSPGGVWNFV